ncbi:uncharacterized protein BJX67DRAFT_200519 [Aspergillus lucknowensis]|uniref:Uncharacterized protein n=1 Tax=Aspergillus lucknowensis TaxID=176173 RepID=A0ABR4LJC9_9EURO
MHENNLYSTVNHFLQLLFGVWGRLEYLFSGFSPTDLPEIILAGYRSASLSIFLDAYAIFFFGLYHCTRCRGIHISALLVKVRRSFLSDYPSPCLALTIIIANLALAVSNFLLMLRILFMHYDVCVYDAKVHLCSLSSYTYPPLLFLSN